MKPDQLDEVLPQADVVFVSAPHTEHISTFLRRSGETDFFACSSRSAGITGSGFACILRFIGPQFNLHYDRKHPAGQPTLSFDVLRSFRDVYYHGHFQGRSAARAFLSGSHASMFSPQVDLRRHSVCAHRTMGQAMSVFFS